MTWARAAAAVVLLYARAAHAQSITTEVDVSGGYSSQETAAAATQFRAFGRASHGIQFFVEAAMAADFGTDSDAFGAAYPYERGARMIEAYGERFFRSGDLVAGVRAGRFRTPFGLYDRGEHAYMGFTRAPLIRYDTYFALSNNYLEHGAAGFIGMPRLLVEASIGAPADVGEARRRPGVDTVVRVQGYAGPLIVGASHIRTQPYLPETFATGDAVFSGIDARWMTAGVQVRGEWLWGRPFSGTSTYGGYLDLSVHRHEMGPVTAVFRVERTDYDTIPRFAMHARRETAGARIRIPGGLTAQVDLVHQTSQVAFGHPVAIDVGLTYSIRH